MAGAALLAGAVLLAALAPWLTPYRVDDQFRDHLLAPPMLPRLTTDDGRWRPPFVYPLVLVDPIERRFVEDTGAPASIRLGLDGRVLAAPDAEGRPWLLLGSDSVGRDVFTRLAHGARLSLAVAFTAALGALLLGVAIGGGAALAGGAVETALMRFADFTLVLPWLYLVAIVRAALPLTLDLTTVFLVLVGILAGLAWPVVARGVRSIVAAELGSAYVTAVVGLGGSRWRLLRHTLPAAAGFVATQVLLLVPAFMLAEATMSFVGWGFPPDRPSWGTMLQEAANLTALGQHPWLLAPAGAMVLITIAIHLLLGTNRPPDLPAGADVASRP
jgi:peptide/nickel transport system permease protein